MDLGKGEEIEVVNLEEDEQIEVIDLDKEMPADKPAETKPEGKRKEFLKKLDPKNRDVYSSAEAEKETKAARKAAEKQRRKEAKRAIKDALKNKGNDDEGRV